MNKKTNLKTFNLYQYLKEKNAHSMNVPYFLANQDTYKDAEVRFPFRTFTYGIGLTYSSKGNNLFKIGSSEYDVKAGCLTTIGPGIVSQWMGNYTSLHDTIYFTEDLFTDIWKISFLQSLSFFLPGGNHVLQLTKEESQKMKSLFISLKKFKNDMEVVPGLTHSLLMLTSKFHNLQNNKYHSPVSNKGRIAGNFRRLVAKHFAEQKDVSFYASQLNITPKYLSEILMEESGKPAKALINAHISMEAKSLLRQTSMTVQEISNWLGYDDTSYFIKTFKKWEGCTPSAYRKL